MRDNKLNSNFMKQIENVKSIKKKKKNAMETSRLGCALRPCVI